MIIKLAVVFAALSGVLGVVLGAFGAHGLKGTIEPKLLEAFQTGVQYQLLHSLALLIVALMMMQIGKSLSFEVSVYAFIAGIVLFSGSLYGLALTEMRWFGPVTPLGGLCFITGWIALCVGAVLHVD
jgi:uncharacterized membrane protein YgdD (TMEM256/DUF423 family)